MEVTQDMRQKAIDYKKNIAGKFMLVEGDICNASSTAMGLQ